MNTKKTVMNRRAVLRNGALAAGAATLGTVFAGGAKAVFGSTMRSDSESNEGLNRGDTAILRFVAAAELIESDLWQQYAELGGLTSGMPIETDPGQTLNAYQNALSQLDGDGPQYITSNTLDEISHANFLNKYLEWKGAEPVDFDQFRTLQGSTASGAQNIGRLTNLMHLNVDTSWFLRYRSATNPDFGATFPQAITITNRTAIPITNADFNDPNHIQIIANTAAFHFGAIEQGGSSLYQAMGHKASSLETLRIKQAIGGDEVAHFLEWVDFAGNGVQGPVAPVSSGGLTFPDFFTKGPEFQPSLIFPVPCEFISPNLPHCAVIRPVTDELAGARAAIAGFIASGLFTGQQPKFLKLLQQMAVEADEAKRELY
jgi:hypothetical protein